MNELSKLLTRTEITTEQLSQYPEWVGKGLNAFVESVEHYFLTITNQTVKVGTPFLVKDIAEYTSDYTGIIGISGNYSGSVRFTAPHSLLTHLLSALGIFTSQEEKLKDLVGEVSNTISGNVRRVFGDKFMLSVPKVVQGDECQSNESFKAKIQCFVIPVEWNNRKAHLIANIN